MPEKAEFAQKELGKGPHSKKKQSPSGFVTDEWTVNTRVTVLIKKVLNPRLEVHYSLG